MSDLAGDASRRVVANTQAKYLYWILGGFGGTPVVLTLFTTDGRWVILGVSVVVGVLACRYLTPVSVRLGPDTIVVHWPLRSVLVDADSLRLANAVIAGQTWHWIHPTAGAAKAAQVLRPGGRLAVFWNVFEFPKDLGDTILGVYARVLPDSPFSRGTCGGLAAYSPLLTKAAEGMREVPGFEEPEQWRFDWERTYTADEWLDQVPTSGGHNQLPPGNRDDLLTGIKAAIDAVGGAASPWATPRSWSPQHETPPFEPPTAPVPDCSQSAESQMAIGNRHELSHGLAGWGS